MQKEAASRAVAVVHGVAVRVAEPAATAEVIVAVARVTAVEEEMAARQGAPSALASARAEHLTRAQRRCVSPCHITTHRR